LARWVGDGVFLVGVVVALLLLPFMITAALGKRLLRGFSRGTRPPEPLPAEREVS